jgi:hypothetical protein
MRHLLVYIIHGICEYQGRCAYVDHSQLIASLSILLNPSTCCSSMEETRRPKTAGRTVNSLRKCMNLILSVGKESSARSVYIVVVFKGDILEILGRYNRKPHLRNVRCHRSLYLFAHFPIWHIPFLPALS